MALKTTLYSDPGCPWAYSENPALAVLRWRYADGLDWRFVAVGLAETTERYVKNGYTPARQARGYRDLGRRPGPASGPPATACRSAASRASASSPPAPRVARSSRRGFSSPAASGRST